jgi:hypothetical protein
MFRIGGIAKSARQNMSATLPLGTISPNRAGRQDASGGVARLAAPSGTLTS